MFMQKRSQFDKSEKWAYLAYFVSWCVVGSPSFLRRDYSRSNYLYAKFHLISVNNNWAMLQFTIQ
jgi:hypothetical protein